MATNESECFSADHVVNRFLVLQQYNVGLQLATVKKYGRFLDRLAAWLLTLKPPCSVLKATAEMLEQWTGLELHRAKLMPQTRRIAIIAVRGFYHWAKEAGFIESNPAEHLPSPKCGSPLPKPAQLQHAESLIMAPDLNTFVGLRDAAMLAVLIGTGCRVSGLVGLNEGDLIWTQPSKNKCERLSIRLCEKGKKERIVPCPMETGLFIRCYLGHARIDEQSRRLPNGDQVLFVNQNNPRVRAHERHGEKLRIRADSFGAILKRYGRDQKVPNRVLHPHAFRHLFATELAEEDVDLLIRQALLGHADPGSTSLYTQLAIRKLFDTVDRANPLGKIKTPVSDLANQMRAAERAARNKD
jgi:integrase/recombinase XerD